MSVATRPAATLCDALGDCGLGAGGLVEDAGRLTTTKVRVVTDRHQQVARVDYEQDGEAAGAIEDALVDRATALAARAGAIVFSDYLKGCVTQRLVRELVGVAQIPPHPCPDRSEDPAYRLLPRGPRW